jgi:hypothetical protein
MYNRLSHLAVTITARSLLLLCLSICDSHRKVTASVKNVHMTYRARAHTWQLRVAITERASAQSAQRKTSTIYLVHFLRSDLVLASALKVRGGVCAHFP